MQIVFTGSSHGHYKGVPSMNILYSGYNLRGAIFANHQIFHLAVIFAIVKFANYCMYCVTFCMARSIFAPVAYRCFDYS